MLDIFRNLFSGGELGYGEWHVPGGAVTRKGAAPLDAYESHLAGHVGLGIVPVREDGTCSFAAIDIDDDKIDHKALYAKVVSRGMPLAVCRSKSGGAHLYLFMDEPRPASEIRQTLKRWAKALGYPNAEVFPKQDTISETNVGSWINLPYFAGERTTRYAVNASGAVELIDFLANIQYYDGRLVDESVNPAKGVKVEPQMPPCLVALTKDKIKEGGRNSTVFNLAVFFRKSSKSNEDWKEKVKKFNERGVDPPLSRQDVTGILNSVNQRKYQYTCENEPLKSVCDRAACEKLTFGVNCQPWNEESEYDPFEPVKLKKVLTNPPRYILVLSHGNEIELADDEFVKFSKVRHKLLIHYNLMVNNLKQKDWETIIKQLLMNREDISAPEDASFGGMVREKLEEFLALREMAQHKEDLVRGLPVTVNGTVYFKVSDFKHHLQKHKLDRIENPELFTLLKKYGCQHTSLVLMGKAVTVWTYPVEQLNAQTQDFPKPDFGPDNEL